jgi:demethylmenaquinone methyltransferase/2-methoxy-6-polyprenyl-1,4-benzoquinol methylase
MPPVESESLADQIAYYRARASEYDQWWGREGQYDHGPEWNKRWFADVEEVRRSLRAFGPRGRVLELACGTGWWTRELVKYPTSVTALDSSPETLELNRARVRSSDVRYVQTDVFRWQPDDRYDLAFFSFWLSHVPPERFEAFWQLVASALEPGGRVFFVDSLRSERSGGRKQPAIDGRSVTVRRRLNDGREFRVVKVYYSPEDLAGRLQDLGWNIQVGATDNFFLYGFGGRA